MAWLKAVVMICGPHHPNAACTARHEGTQCFSRVDHAIRVARTHGLPLIVCGDANEGRDVRAFAKRARDAGVVVVSEAILGRPSNTYSDLELAAQLLVRDPEFADVGTFILVTDPWHAPRAEAMARAVIASVCTAAGRAPFTLVVSEVDPCWWPAKDMLEREAAGLRAFLDGTYRGGHAAGKPELEASQSAN